MIVLVLIALGGWYYANPSKPPVDETPTTRIQRGTLSRTVTATGVIRPVVGAEINVGSRVSGTVKTLRVKVGDAVNAGDLLAQIEQEMFQARVNQARAELEGAKAQLSLSKFNVERAEKLLKKGFGSEEDLQKAQQDLAMAIARINLNQARLQGADIDLGYTSIYAPIKGVIANVTTREGETVAASFAAPTFVTIIDLERLETRAFVDETDIGRIFLGQQASFTVDAYPDVDIPAQVTAIQPKAEMQGSVVNYVVVLEFQTPDQTILRPEMTTHIRFTLEERENVITAPRGVLKRKDGGDYVMVKRKQDWVEQKVRVGWRTAAKAEILEGLEEGETVRVN